MWLMGLVAPRHVGSSQTRARTHVPYIGRQTLNHCTTREARKACIFVLVDTFIFILYTILLGTSLVVQWLRIRLPMKGTWVQSVVRDPTCRGATKPTHRNYGTRTPQLESPRATTMELTCSGAHVPQLERSPRVAKSLPAGTKDPTCRN